ncbi:hypothetical protein [uncultured Methanobrevibacter sp.]|uniref:hypothetical protein n=1 Tax=uncultured Methanobrevibacter sp. TaxID=253161 RepID=UPI0025D248DC|nr:hypothetical protein [uncultured Methanobrevibacter sp.]
MADKEVYIGNLKVMWGTNVKVSPETNITSTATFDGVLTDGTDKIPYSISVDRLRYGTQNEYMTLHEKLDAMLTTPETIKIVETVRTSTEAFKVIDYVYNCLVDNDEYEIKADERTVEGLSFKGSSKKRKYQTLKK